MIRVLYVDDEPAILDTCRKILEKAGAFQVTTVLSGEEALGRVRSESFDVVVSDYQMEDINGLDLLKIIRNEIPSMPFIIFTGRGREDVVIEAFEHGVDYYVQKGGEAKAQYAELAHKIELAVENRRIKKKLARSEQRFLDFVKNFEGIAFQISSTGKFFLLDGSIEETTGYRREDFISGSVTLESIIHTDDRDRFLANKRKLSTIPGFRAEVIFRIMRKDGPVRWLHGVFHNICTRTNEIVHIQGSLSDITYLKSAQEELARTEEKWRSIITKAPVTISVLDRAGRILFINKARPPKKPADLLGTDAKAYFAPDDAKAIGDALHRVFSTGEMIRFESAVPLGENLTEWLAHQASPILWNGSKKAALVVSTIITERKWLEQSLRDSEEQYRAIVTASGDGIAILDKDGTITFGSPRVYDIFEIPGDEPLIGKKVMDFIDPSFHQVARWRMYNILSGDLDAEPFEYLLVTRGNRRFRGELVTTPLRDSSGNIGSLLVLIRDISKRKPDGQTAAVKKGE
jgi:PAS domain S-box-containing protein